MNRKGDSLQKLYQELDRKITKKSILSIVDDGEMQKHIDYSPSYQRNYIWSDTKAIKLIETIILNREVPPLTVIESDDRIEIIDGRQRYESILRFFKNEFRLNVNGLSILKPLDGLKYSDLPPNIKCIFDEYKLKFITYEVSKGSELTNEEISHIKRDLFRRYNYGMTALSKSEVARAKYLYDDLTNLLRNEFLSNEDRFQLYVNLYLPATKRKLNNRDKMNLMLVIARELLSITYIPIIGVKNVVLSSSCVEKYYECFVKKENLNDKMDEFTKISQKVAIIREKLNENGNKLFDNILFFKCVYWMLAILYKQYPIEFYNFNVNQFLHYLEDEQNAEEYFDNYKNLNSLHIINRHMYVKDYLVKSMNLDLDSFFKKIVDNRREIIYKTTEKLNNKESWYGIKNNKQITTIDDSFSIKDIIKFQRDNRLIIRPIYQRGEVRSLEKASRIIESIILGIKLPPIYVMKEFTADNKQKYTVIDGQQRLISILTFLGEQVLDENYDFIKTLKKEYALTGLKDLDYLNGLKHNSSNFISRGYESLILNYQLDVIKIENDENFDSVDMFLRLNENPCTISKNSFEMWNSFEITKIIQHVKELSKHELFKQRNGNSMKEEELVTTLAYLEKEDICFDNFFQYFKTHLYTENKNKSNERLEVKISIKNKSAMTRFLEDLVPRSKDEEEFDKCLDEVEIFIEKVEILVDDKCYKLIEIFNPYIATPRKGSMKDFYLLWLILSKIDKHVIMTYKNEILQSLSKIYKLMKNMPVNSDVDYFFEYVKDILKKFSV